MSVQAKSKHQHISVSIFGQIRTVDGWKNQVGHMLNANTEFTTFMHTWTQEETERKPRLFDPQIGKPWHPLILSNKEALSTIQPNDWLIEDNDEEIVDACKGVGPQPDTRHRTMSMWRSQYLAGMVSTANINTKNVFNYMVRTRTELMFRDNPFEFLNSHNLQEGYVYIPDGNNGGNPEIPSLEGTNDWFAAAKPTTFWKISRLYTELEKLLQNRKELFAEKILRCHLDKHNIRIVRFPARCYLKRV